MPKRLREEIRQEICQNMCVAVLAGEVAIKDIAAASEKYIRPEMRRGNDTRVLSIDYPIGGSGSTPLKHLI